MLEALLEAQGIPTRAYFPDVAPLGVDGATRENLFSLVCRIALSHYVHPHAVAENKVWPIVKHMPGMGGSAFSHGWKEGTMSGFGPMAKAWVHGMNTLCVRDDLDRLTLLPLEAWLHGYRLGLCPGRHCPACVENDLSSPLGPYDRLLWTLPMVNACPIHEVRLLDYCACGRTAARTYFTPGRCRHCDEPLAISPAEPADARSVDVARRVARLLDAASAFKHITPRHDRTAQFLSHAIKAHYGGKYCVFAREFDESKSNVHGWVNAKTTPSLPVLLKLSQFFDVPVEDTILGNKPDTCVQGLRTCAPELVERQRRNASTIIDWAATRDSIESDLANPLSSRTLGEIATSLGIGMRTLRKELPELCDAVFQRTKTRIRNKAIVRVSVRRDHYLETHARLSRVAGRSVSRRKVLAAATECRYDRTEANQFQQKAVKRFALASRN
ncbi:hypothetical protein PAQ31011_00689 [Pandoraea aquatica]|uniref:HTH cro/C1-type domain-containing protein n=1 Tax=Pandoraea aquatica TaxID=2508290 RepID=A0A5E4SAJ5_9BURK|nr:hypothetical protein PAQ31011_00689 [Pandoraea aquatica]